MLSFFIWTLIKVIFLVFAGHFIYKAISKSQTTKEEKFWEKEFEENRKKNAYLNSQPDFESILQIKGLQLQQQKHIRNTKPTFYFRLDKKNTLSDITFFLSSLPDNFLVKVPALMISLEDSLPMNIYFWKSEGNFQLTYLQNMRHIPFAKLSEVELAEKIFSESRAYNLQNVSIEKIEFK